MLPKNGESKGRENVKYIAGVYIQEWTRKLKLFHSYDL